MLVPWRRRHPGQYRIEARDTEWTWHPPMEVEPRPLGQNALGQLLKDLSCQILASIALAPDEYGAHLAIDRGPPEAPMLQEGLQRPRWASR